MGMAVGDLKRGPVSDPNIVPLIDVLLVLIIIFMVITPKPSTGLPTLIPEPAPPQPAIEPPATIIVQVLRDNRVMINDDASDWNSLGARLSNIFKERADKVAFVKGANEVPFEEVARAIDVMRSAGVEHIGLITAKITSEE